MKDAVLTMERIVSLDRILLLPPPCPAAVGLSVTETLLVLADTMDEAPPRHMGRTAPSSSSASELSLSESGSCSSTHWLMAAKLPFRSKPKDLPA